MIRYILYNDEYGIYLGQALGLGFWSNLDPAGQDAACTFVTREEAFEHAASWSNPVPELASRAVECENIYATIAECVLSGLPSWDPDLGDQT